MKNYLFISALALVMASCGSRPGNSYSTDSTKSNSYQSGRGTANDSTLSIDTTTSRSLPPDNNIGRDTFNSPGKMDSLKTGKHVKRPDSTRHKN